MARLATDDRMERYVSLQNSNSYPTDLQQNFIGDFKIGSLRNRIVVGLDYLNQVTNNDNSPYITFDTVSGVSSTPSYIQLNQSAVEAKLAASTLAPTKTNTTSNVYSACLRRIQYHRCLAGHGQSAGRPV